MMSKTTKARLLLLLIAAMLITITLAACGDDPEEITLSFSIRNATEYEIQKIIFVGDNYTGRGNPFVYITIVGSANSNDYVHDDVPLAPGDERIYTLQLDDKILNGPWGVEVEAYEAELRDNNKSLALNENVKGFVVFYAEETEFMFAPFYND